jgi:hypothetical protein
MEGLAYLRRPGFLNPGHRTSLTWSRNGQRAGKCFVPSQFSARPFDALFKLAAKQTGIAFVDFAADPQKAPIVLDQSLGAPSF